MHILLFETPLLFLHLLSMQHCWEHPPLKAVCCGIYYHCAYASLALKVNSWKCDISSVQKKW